MSEEVKIKISQPMFEVGELEIFDNNIHSIVEEYSKMLFKEKDQILTQRIIMKQEEEIERLTISLQAQEELTMNWYNKVKNARDLFYEKCRISQNGAYIFNEVDYEELSNILGSDKE